MGPQLTRLADPNPVPSPSPVAPDPLWREALGAFLRDVRTTQRRILTDIAAEAKVSPQYLSEIERGRKEPSSEILAAVSGALGLTLAQVARGVADVLTQSALPEPAVMSVGGVTRTSTSAARSTGRAHLRMVS